MNSLVFGAAVTCPLLLLLEPTLDTEAVTGLGLAAAGLASVDERDTTCCYAKQDKFWVEGAPNGERWEIYTVKEDSATFWGADGGRSWDAVEARLDGDQEGAQCCGGPQQAGEAGSESAACCA